MTFRKQMLLWCGISLCGAIFINGTRVLAEWSAISQSGSDGFLWMTAMGLVFPFLLAIVIIPISVILLIFNKTRKAALFGLLASIIYLVVAFSIPLLSERVRMHGFHKLAERSVPLVQAIHKFEDEKGRPPTTLQELVPEYLPSIPNTGMGAYPTYEYMTGKETHRWTNDSWVLYVNTPAGGINFDIFAYLPSHNYQKTNFRFDGYPERIDDWAYVHD